MRSSKSFDKVVYVARTPPPGFLLLPHPSNAKGGAGGADSTAKLG